MTKRYRATARIDGKKVHLGYFDTEADRKAAQEQALKSVDRGTIYEGVRATFPCKQCPDLALAAADAFGRCPKHLRRLRQLQGTHHNTTGEDECGDTVDFDEWCILRGYDPVTRTYSGDPAPLARLDGDLLS